MEENEDGTGIQLDLSSMKVLKPMKEFSRIKKREDAEIRKIHDLSYSKNGQMLLMAANDNAIVVYTMSEGYEIRHLDSKKYGVGLVEYITDNECIHSSIYLDNKLRHLTIDENKYVRYYNGHEQSVNCLIKHPTFEYLVSSSQDKSIRFWDVRSEACMGTLLTSSNPLIAIDPDGIVLAVATNNEIIRLYDTKSYDCGYFRSFKIPIDDDKWIRIEFSPCGKFIIISTNGLTTKLIDAFTGEIRHVFRGHQNENQANLYATITPDSRFLMVGGSDRNIHFYSIEKPSLSFKLPSPHTDIPNRVLFNPKLFSFASACRKLVLWSPDQEFCIKNGVPIPNANN